MSILGSILSKVFHTNQAAAAPAPAPADTSAPADTDKTAADTSAAPAQTAAASDTTKAQAVDVTAILDGLAAKAGQKLDWRHSIVDLMKLLGLDSSHSARIELANELHYTGDVHDSAAMNIWLHKQVMEKFAENGGKVPDDLRH
jgi:3-oxoacyl-ACP reductase-like protein